MSNELSGNTFHYHPFLYDMGSIVYLHKENIQHITLHCMGFLKEHVSVQFHITMIY